VLPISHTAARPQGTSVPAVQLICLFLKKVPGEGELFKILAQDLAHWFSTLKHLRASSRKTNKLFKNRDDPNAARQCSLVLACASNGGLTGGVCSNLNKQANNE